MTIHKCQGMTLAKLCAHLPPQAKMGMDYVWASRARALHGMVISEDECKVSHERLMRVGLKCCLKTMLTFSASASRLSDKYVVPTPLEDAILLKPLRTEFTAKVVA